MYLPCPNCHGKTSVYTSLQTSNSFCRYTRCTNCQEKFRISSEGDVAPVKKRSTNSHISIQELSLGDKFKTSFFGTTFWEVIKISSRLSDPVTNKWETVITAKSVKSSRVKHFTESNSTVYIEGKCFVP